MGNGKSVEYTKQVRRGVRVGKGEMCGENQSFQCRGLPSGFVLAKDNGS